MASPRILVRESEQEQKAYLRPAPDFGWQLLGVLGAALLLVGMLDIGLAWFPLNFGNPDWEFGTVASTFDSLPVPLMGFALLIGAAVARGNKRATRIIAVLMIVMAVFVLGALLLYALNIPLGFRMVEEPMIRTGLKKAVTKAIGQGVLYPGAFLIIAIRALQHSKSTR